MAYNIKKPYPQPVIQSNTNESNQIQLVGLRVEHTVEFIRGGSYPNPLFASIQCCPIIMPRTNKQTNKQPLHTFLCENEEWKMTQTTGCQISYHTPESQRDGNQRQRQWQRQG
jgi:hypothetical protein